MLARRAQAGTASTDAASGLLLHCGNVNAQYAHASNVSSDKLVLLSGLIGSFE
jgi:hypothetical protein